MKSKRFPRVLVTVMVVATFMAAMLPVAMAEGSPAPAANADLSGITLSSGALSPVFDAGVLAYSVTVAPQTQKVMVTPQLADAAASLKMDGQSVPSLAVDVAPGQMRTVSIEVTAQDGIAKKTYAVNVTRTAPPHGRLAGIGVSTGTLSPAFLPLKWRYDLKLDENTSAVTITPEKGYASDVVKINGKSLLSVKVDIPRKGGSKNVIITVKADTGRKFSGVYFIHITRARSSDASLKAIRTSPSGLIPAFDPATLSYSVTILNKKSVVMVQPVTAQKGSRVWIDGKKVSARIYHLTAGTPKVVTIKVQAPDGKTTKTYTLTLTRSLPPA